MKTLLLRCVGPQAWGIHLRADHRMTARHPIKSPVIGMICCGMGKRQDAEGKDGLPTIDRLCSLRMGVRIDDPGIVALDFCTAGGGRHDGVGDSIDFGKIGKTSFRTPRKYFVSSVDGKQDKNPEIVYKYFLEDAAFLVGLEGDDDLVEAAAEAVRNPKWTIYMGRKQFLPWIPLLAGVKDAPLEDALRSIPWLLRDVEEVSGSEPAPLPVSVQYIIECDKSRGRPARDVPTSFRFGSPRSFGTRYVREEHGPVPNSRPARPPRKS